MTTSLLNYLQKVQDFRTGRGLKHELWVILLLIIMAVLSGSQSYLALEDFGQHHYPALREKLGLKTEKAPSDTTYRRILRQLDFNRSPIASISATKRSFCQLPSKCDAIAHPPAPTPSFT